MRVFPARTEVGTPRTRGAGSERGRMGGLLTLSSGSEAMTRRWCVEITGVPNLHVLLVSAARTFTVLTTRTRGLTAGVLSTGTP